MVKTLEGRAADYVEEASNRIHVDWEGLAQLKWKFEREGDGSRSFNPLFENLLDYLEDKGILTFSTDDSWTLTGGGFDLSPKKPAPSSILYFTRKEDAETYRDAFYRYNIFKVSAVPARDTV